MNGVTPKAQTGASPSHARQPDLDGAASAAYAMGMAGPSSKPEREARAPAYVPHPDDVDDVRRAFSDDGELLSAEESDAYLHWLETGEAPEHLRQFFETGKRPWPASRS